MRLREYGSKGPIVVLVHGGPGAAGYLGPLARALADQFRVLEPFQRGSGGELLTVARHVEDLQELIQFRCQTSKPALAGHSWGAMLALAYAAQHPDCISSLALIGCGTFDPEARERLGEVLDRRINRQLRRRLAELHENVADPNQRLREQGRLLMHPYSHDLISDELEAECDAEAYFESWEDMLRLQENGVYPNAFDAIRAPVLMLHGSADPHPGPMIRDSLLPYLPHLEYREWERCGHYPWLERAVREEFLEALGGWLAGQEGG